MHLVLGPRGTTWWEASLNGAGPSPESNAAESAGLLIVGLGNPFMVDDGIGHEVVRRLRTFGPPPGVRLAVLDGDVLGLASMWAGEREVWLVDAVSGDRAAGSVHVYDHPHVLSLPTGEFSAHHPSLGESLRWLLLGHPEMADIEFRLYGLEVDRVRPGRGLSSAVEPAVAELASSLLQEASASVAINPGGRPAVARG